MISIPIIVWLPVFTGVLTGLITYLFTKYKTWENIKKHIFGF
ncbi:MULTISPECIES: hypothetical protein [Companilactobacillus]|nr:MULTISPECIES: hypothetical protein [Companilactobacillus]